MAKLVDDAKSETRQPSHSDLEYIVNRAGLLSVDPKTQGQTVGKAKRIRAILGAAIENDYEAGRRCVTLLLSHVRTVGGFRAESPNYVGPERISDIRIAFKKEGYNLTNDGQLLPLVLDNLSGFEQQQALMAYVFRAKRGAEDAALLIGTSKDLLEAVAAYVIQVKRGNYSTTVNFPTLLGQAFTALNLATSNDVEISGEAIQRKIERHLYQLGCAINKLRNKQGTGHGRPYLPSVSVDEARTATECMGIIAEYLLTKL